MKCQITGIMIRGNILFMFLLLMMPVSLQANEVIVDGDFSVTGSISGDGSGLTNVAPSTHEHLGNEITSGTVGESLIDSQIARDSEVASSVNAHTSNASAHHYNTIVVSPGGLDIQSALDSISDNSSANPYLIKIEPGVYDVGTNTVTMKPYVDIEGSGENVTKIRGNIDGSSGVVAGADNSEIRLITVENTGGGSFAFGIILYNVSPKVTNVTAIASGAQEQLAISCEANCTSVMTNVTAIASGGVSALGFYIDDGASPTIMNAKAIASDSILNLGFNLNNNASPTMTNIISTALRGSKTHGLHFNGGSSPVMTNVRVIASGATGENYAVYNINSSSPELNNITADASGVNSYGVYTKNYGSYTGGTVRIDHSVIKVTTNAVYTDTTFTTLVGNTRIGGSMTGPGTNKCAGVYDASHTFYASTCP